MCWNSFLVFVCVYASPKSCHFLLRSKLNFCAYSCAKNKAQKCTFVANAILATSHHQQRSWLLGSHNDNQIILLSMGSNAVNTAIFIRDVSLQPAPTGTSCLNSRARFKDLQAKLRRQHTLEAQEKAWPTEGTKLSGRRRALPCCRRSR